VSNDNAGAAQQGERRQNREDSFQASFVVEFADKNSSNFTITTPPLQGVDIRGRWDTSRMAQREQGMRDLGTAATRIPSPIPGARLAVDIRRAKATLFDPLQTTKEGREVLERYNAVAKGIPALRKDCKPFETLQYQLDEDQLKTLLYELLRKMDSGCLDIVEGSLPTLQELEKIPGHELYDPGNNSEDKPRYKKDLKAWRDRQRAAGAI
jgi:hypothetical protein